MVDTTVIRQWLRSYLVVGLLYALFFLSAFVVSVYLTFPYDRLRDYLVSKVEASGKGQPDAMQLAIGELEPSFFTGVVLTDVDLHQRAPEPNTEPSALHFDQLSARVSAFSLLLRAPKVHFHGKVGEGELDGTYQQDAEAQHIEAELDALDVGRFGLGSFIGVPLKGRASGKLDLTLPAEAPKTAGEFQLKIAGLRIGDGKAKLSLPGLSSGMTLDELDAGTLDLAIKADKGTATISRFVTDGKDLKLRGDGTVRLATPIRRSRPDIQLELKVSDSYKNKTDRTKALFEILGMQPDWQRATGSDGALNLHIAGTLQSPKASPGVARARKH